LRTNANNIKYIILVVGHRLLELLQIIVAAGTQQQGLQILAVQLQHPIAVSHSLPGIADPRVDQSPIIKQFRVDILVVLVDLQGVRVDDMGFAVATRFEQHVAVLLHLLELLALAAHLLGLVVIGVEGQGSLKVQNALLQVVGVVQAQSPHVNRIRRCAVQLHHSHSNVQGLITSSQKGKALGLEQAVSGKCS